MTRKSFLRSLEGSSAVLMGIAAANDLRLFLLAAFLCYIVLRYWSEGFDE